jgi:hypothetical protein
VTGGINDQYHVTGGLNDQYHVTGGLHEQYKYLYLGTSFKKLLCCFDPQFIFSASKI